MYISLPLALSAPVLVLTVSCAFHVRQGRLLLRTIRSGMTVLVVLFYHTLHIKLPILVATEIQRLS